eukprot:853926-Amphidinium_carterae.2
MRQRISSEPWLVLRWLLHQSNTQGEESIRSLVDEYLGHTVEPVQKPVWEEMLEECMQCDCDEAEGNRIRVTCKHRNAFAKNSA